LLTFIDNLKKNETGEHWERCQIAAKLSHILKGASHLFGFLQPWGINPSRAQAIYLAFCSLGELTPQGRKPFIWLFAALGN